MLRSATVTNGRAAADPALPAEVTREQHPLRIRASGATLMGPATSQ